MHPLSHRKRLVCAENWTSVSPCLEAALVRYVDIWLPAAAAAQRANVTLGGAPIDVLWIWHCHLLCPTKYRADCAALCVGGVIPGRGLHSFTLELNLSNSRTRS
jgi:hypothetical protein